VPEGSVFRSALSTGLLSRRSLVWVDATALVAESGRVEA
jgi:hypothetical protein